MKQIDKNLVEKFFQSRSTPEETKRVLEWFETLEGKRYLEERLDADFDLMDVKGSDIRALVPEFESDEAYKLIQKEIRTSHMAKRERRRDLLAPVLKVAATVLLILTASLFFYITYDASQDAVAEQESIHFQTTDDQQRVITLGDGSVIRLNSNSEILISGDFMRDTREVTLTGEAFFEVEHDPAKPFIIHANRSSIQVLGTAFNVKSVAGRDNVQVAVVEGKVSFSGTENNRDKHFGSVVLSGGEYGYMDIGERTIVVDDVAIENYLAWKNGRLIFSGHTLEQVCTQLGRLYDVECSYADETLKALRLTANFSSDSLEKTLSVISASLQIDYKKEEGARIYWRNED